MICRPAVVHRTARSDGFIGNLTQQSQEGALPRQAVDFIRQPEDRVIEYPRSLHVCSDFSLKHRQIPFILTVVQGRPASVHTAPANKQPKLSAVAWRTALSGCVQDAHRPPKVRAPALRHQRRIQSQSSPDSWARDSPRRVISKRAQWGLGSNGTENGFRRREGCMTRRRINDLLRFFCSRAHVWLPFEEF